MPRPIGPNDPGDASITAPIEAVSPKILGNHT
jgi:hypothetical protein